MKSFSFFLIILLSQIGFSQCDSLLPLNQKVVDYASKNLNKKVGRGECWDLAKFALDQAGAKWDGKYEYGKKLAKTDCLMPGDIIQFENVVLEYKIGNKTYRETMQHHTSIIFSVTSNDEVVLIHQNTGYTGRKVGKSKLTFSTIKKGKYTIYRPTN